MYARTNLLVLTDYLQTRYRLREVEMRVQVTPELARTQLAHVRWICGGTGAGKSTVAVNLTERLGLRLYSCEPISAYVPRVQPGG
jgi:polynucleotide 5'-kinase involved in rRNA processing